MFVLDSSVFIAVMKSEPHSERLLEYFDGSLICSINHSEVLQKFAQLGGSIETAAELMAGFDCEVVPFDRQRSGETASLWPLTRNKGLSLADRSCLALARAMNGVAVSTDRAWANLDIPGIDVQVIAR